MSHSSQAMLPLATDAKPYSVGSGYRTTEKILPPCKGIGGDYATLNSYQPSDGTSKYCGGQRDVEPDVDPAFSRFGFLLRRDNRAAGGKANDNAHRLRRIGLRSSNAMRPGPRQHPLPYAEIGGVEVSYLPSLENSRSGVPTALKQNRDAAIPELFRRPSAPTLP
jgi:hypothetical protein